MGYDKSIIKGYLQDLITIGHTYLVNVQHITKLRIECELKGIRIIVNGNNIRRII